MGPAEIAAESTTESAVTDPRFDALNVPVYRASTLVFENTAAFLARKSQLFDGYSYGLYGTPTTRALEAEVARAEGGRRTTLLPSGLAALTHTALALLSAGDHVLVADCVYGPLREYTVSAMQRLGITVDFIAADAADLSAHLKPRTRLVSLESPGSFTMEIQDIAALCRQAHAAGARVLMDNTWGFGRSCMFEHGVDIVATALSKYGCGHSDVCMGAVTVREESLFKTLKRAFAGMGTGVSSDDAYLVLRGMGTLDLRLAEQARRGLQISQWLRSQPAVARVMNPADPADPGHLRFQQYFSGGNGLVSFMPRTQRLAAISAMLDGFRHFRIGASWGGISSLAAVTDLATSRSVSPRTAGNYIVRLHAGLERFDDLMQDLAKGLQRLHDADPPAA